MSHGRVADPEHQHPLAAQHVGLAVVVGVDLLAVELVRARERRLGPARVPVVAVGDQHRAVAAAASLAVLARAVTSQPPVRPARRAVTSVRKRIRSRKPKWST